MKYCRLLLLSLYLYLPSVFSLSCPPGSCKTVDSADCSTKETVLNPCNCPVCAHAEGEKCGGIWFKEGNRKCASYLTCKLQKPKDRGVRFPKEHWTGVCVKNETDITEKIVEMLISMWNMLMDYIMPWLGWTAKGL